MTSIVASTASIRVAAPASAQMRVARGCARVNARHASAAQHARGGRWLCTNVARRGSRGRRLPALLGAPSTPARKRSDANGEGAVLRAED